MEKWENTFRKIKIEGEKLEAFRIRYLSVLRKLGYAIVFIIVAIVIIPFLAKGVLYIPYSLQPILAFLYFTYYVVEGLGAIGIPGRIGVLMWFAFLLAVLFLNCLDLRKHKRIGWIAISLFTLIIIAYLCVFFYLLYVGGGYIPFPLH